MKKLLISTLILSLTISAFADKTMLKSYPHMRTAKLKGTPGNIAAIPLDRKIYKNTNDRYSNIRIVDKDGRNIPFAVNNVYPLTEKKIYADLPVKLSGYHADKAKKQAEINVTLNFPAGFSRISFPDIKQFESAKINLNFFDNEDQDIGEDQIFRLNPPEQNSGEINVDFPSVNAKKINITMELPNDKLLKDAESFLKKVKIKQLIFLEVPTEPKLANINLPEISRFNKGSLTEITVDAHRIPCTELKISCDDKSFKRYAEVFSKNHQTERCIASQNISETNEIIPLPEVRGQYYIIRIHNADKQPLKNIRLQWKAKERVLMFIPPEQGDLQIYYGGNAKQFPYDIEYAQRHGLPPQIYELGEEIDSPYYEPQIPVINLYQYFAWIIIIIAAMLFLLTVVRMLNRNSDWDSSRKK
ncbi:MAG: hypothetical protein IKB25_02215 [Lentisphaeria bacterium]|nr:hypothetical protein [Lentisphaeria bacterium]